MTTHRRRAQIRSRDRRYPFALRVSVDERGVRWDRMDSTGPTFMVLNTSVKSARTLAQWILDNTTE